MLQKVLKIGSSAAVTIPKKTFKELGVKIGDEVQVQIDRSQKTTVLRTAVKLSPSDKKIAKLTLNFIQRYRKDLEALAHK